MRHFVAAVWDNAVQAYLPPLFFRTEQEASRAFTEGVKHNEQFRVNPSDYSLHHVGFFDDGVGQFDNLPQPRLVMTAMQVALSNPFGTGPSGDHSTPPGH